MTALGDIVGPNESVSQFLDRLVAALEERHPGLASVALLDSYAKLKWSRGVNAADASSVAESIIHSAYREFA